MKVFFIGAGPGDPGLLTLHAVNALRQADVVIYDAGWGLSNDDVLTELAQIPADWTLPVILLIPESDESVSALFNVGFSGILSRSTDPDRLNTVVQAALLDLFVIDPIFLDDVELADNKPASQSGFVEVEPLTPREFDVLELLADGLTNREIGAKLEISHHTVKFHLTSLMDKLDVHSRTEAVTTASRLGILEI